MTAVLYVLEYLFGLGIFGFVWYFLNGILVEFRIVSVTGDVFTFANYMWTAAIVIYLIFGIFWFFSALKEWDVQRRY